MGFLLFFCLGAAPVIIGAILLFEKIRDEIEYQRFMRTDYRMSYFRKHGEWPPD